MPRSTGLSLGPRGRTRQQAVGAEADGDGLEWRSTPSNSPILLKCCSNFNLLYPNATVSRLVPR